jgi:hypothetical protein
MLRKITVCVCAAIIAFVGLELGASWMADGQLAIGQKAEARVGRPLSPVSVAGAGRRTARRCVAGVYSC